MAPIGLHGQLETTGQTTDLPLLRNTALAGSKLRASLTSLGALLLAAAASCSSAGHGDDAPGVGSSAALTAPVPTGGPSSPAGPATTGAGPVPAVGNDANPDGKTAGGSSPRGGGGNDTAAFAGNGPGGEPAADSGGAGGDAEGGGGGLGGEGGQDAEGDQGAGGDQDAQGGQGAGGDQDAQGGQGAGGSQGGADGETGGAPPELGGSPSGAGGGGEVDAVYQPCPTAEPCKVMPLGDSITWGVADEGNGGYRGPLFAEIVAAGQQVVFTGSLSNGPNMVSGEIFPKQNEGHSGWGISRVTPYSGNNAGIATVIPNPGFSAGSGGTPHIILLHIGTNDQGSLSANEMTSDLAGFLDLLTTNAPDAFIVVAQIIPLGYGDNATIKTYNQSIPTLVEERVAAGKHIAVVDMFTGFDAQSMLDSDSTHPNSSGYQLMADRWYSVIGPLLPE